MESTAAKTGKACGGEVTSHQCCDCSPRQSVTQPRRECWFCRYADFHLDRPVALETGICRFPEVQSK